MLLKHMHIFNNSKNDQTTIHIKGINSNIDNSTIWAVNYSLRQSQFEFLLPIQKYFKIKAIVHIHIKASLSKFGNIGPIFIKEYAWSTIVQIQA